MILYLHIGPDIWAATRLQSILAHKRAQLERHGVLVPRGAGGTNHTRLYMAVTDPRRPDVLRANRGYADPASQLALREEMSRALRDEIAAASPKAVILTAHQLAGLSDRSELEELRALLLPLASDIRIIAHVDEPARQLARHYAAQVLEGRLRGLEVELGMAAGIDVGLEGGWWQACAAVAMGSMPGKGIYAHSQNPPRWLDYAQLVRHWDGVFGAGSLQLRSIDTQQLCTPRAAVAELCASFGITERIGKAEPAEAPVFPADAWLARARRMNALLAKVSEVEGFALPRQLCRGILQDLETEGAPVDPGALAQITRLFAPDMLALMAAHPGLTQPGLLPDPAAAPYSEAPVGQGYRPSTYLLANDWRIRRARAEMRKTAQAAEAAAPDAKAAAAEALSPSAAALLSERAVLNFQNLQRSPFRPHNDLAPRQEDRPGLPYAPAAPRVPAAGDRRVVISCMKNEAPYILEWIAYHRAVGFDDFLIYTNGCTDGTDAILRRLDAMGIVHHRDNDGWQGNSPQQWALDQAVEDPLVRDAGWIAHFDVDEFVNIRTGNGTLDDLFAAMPQATNIALTWRLFGHNGITRLSEDFVIAQFDSAAPKYCPKPHTAWGFKTLFRNIGAYSKLSCHRPNKLQKDRAGDVRWFNGSGQEMTGEVLKNGWRNSKRSIGYDLVQLNHYALRSAESYLIKRQRGRALHVDRSIGLNYWIRMDWSDHRDLTIQRNLPRLHAEVDRLRADPELARLERDGLAWHRAKAEELHAMPEFADLYRQALQVRLTPTERVAYALALDLDN